MKDRKVFLLAIIALVVVVGGALILIGVVMGDDTGGTGSQGAPAVVLAPAAVQAAAPTG